MEDRNEHRGADAIERMTAAGMTVEKTSFGFRLHYFEGHNSYVGDCGLENDASEALSIRCIVLHQVRWFHRFSTDEMADFLVAAHRATAPGDDFVATLRRLDSTYDYDRLDERLREAWPEWFAPLQF